MKLIELVDEKLILPKVKAHDSNDVIKILGNVLVKRGYVKDSFIEAVLHREKDYPTGIQGPKYNIAIPHTDNEHVLNPGIAIGTIEDGVFFNRMDEPCMKLNTQIVFLLAIKTPEFQLEALRKIMAMIQDLKVMEELCSCKDASEVINILRREEE